MNTQTNKTFIQTVAIFAVLILFFVLLLGMMKPFFSVLLWSVLLYIIIYPLYRRATARLNPAKRLYQFYRSMLAGIFSAGTLAVIVVPIAIIALLLIRQLADFLSAAEQYLRSNKDFFSSTQSGIRISQLLSQLSMGAIDLSAADIKAQLLDFISRYNGRIISLGTEIISGTGSFIVSLLFIVFTLFFFFLDGEYLISLFSRAIPIPLPYMAALRSKFVQITRNLFSGYILVALYQGCAAYIIMKLFSVNGALLLSVTLLFASFIPMLGAAIVWLPIGIYLCATKTIAYGIFFIILCGFCVSMLDNFLRPFFLKDRIQVHPLVIFFSILGGISLFGMNGLLLGPITVIMFFTVLDLLTEQEEKTVPSETEQQLPDSK